MLNKVNIIGRNNIEICKILRLILLSSIIAFDIINIMGNANINIFNIPRENDPSRSSFERPSKRGRNVQRDTPLARDVHALQKHQAPQGAVPI